MTALPVHRGRRRAPWGDVRFLIGLALVIASVGGVWFVVTAARQTTPVYLAARTIVPGEPVTADDLLIVEAALGASETAYLTPERLGPGVIAARTVSEGEFVPRSAVADAASNRVTTVVVRTANPVPASVARGALVELWSAPALERGTFGTPAVLVADATVSRVDADAGVLRDGAVSLELVVPRADVGRTLEAVAAGAALSIVPGAVGP